MKQQRYTNIPFRPPYVEKDRKVGQLSLLFRFLHEYVSVHTRALALCSLMAVLDYCGSFFLIAYYSKVVVDSILVVQAPPKAPVLPKSTFREDQDRRSFSSHTTPIASVRPTEGLGKQIDRGVQVGGRPPNAMALLTWIGLLYGATILAGSLCTRASRRIQIRVGRALIVQLRSDIHERVMRLSMNWHSTHTPGRIMTRILSDVATVQDQLLTIIVNSVSQLCIIVIGLTMLFLIDGPMALLTIAFLPGYVVIHHVARPILRRISQELSHTNSCLYGLVSQKLDAVKMIQAYGRVQHEAILFHKLAACLFRDVLGQNRLSAATNMAAEILAGLGSSVVVFLFGIYRVLDGSMTLGVMMYAWGIAVSLFMPVLALSSVNVTLTTLLVSLRRLADILDEPVTLCDDPDAIDFPTPLARGIEARNVTFRYPNSEPLLNQISLTVPAGTWMCIMGASGSGKTTLLQVLARLYEHESGEILIDGVPVTRYRLSSLRRHVALVPQEAQILSGTIRDNICYGRPQATPADIMEAAQASEFHDYVMTLPVKYETTLGEKGASLSGGQRQRLSMARALLTHPEVLLLDDCTSALDAETERKIQDTLSRILAGKTAVIVSQRVSMAQRCHRICVLSHGAISELGAHDELVANGQFYARLYAQQTGTPQPAA